MCCNGDHGGIIGTIFERRNVYFPIQFFAQFNDGFAQPRVCRNATRDRNFFYTGFPGRFFEFFNKISTSVY
jgi:hypothetical protein